MNVKFHGYSEHYYGLLEGWTRILSALVGGGAFASLSLSPQLSEISSKALTGSTFSELAGAAAPWLVLFVAAINTVSASFGWGKKIQVHAELAREWITLRFLWEKLERDFESESAQEKDKLEDRFNEIEQRHCQITEREPGAPSRRLLRRCQKEVIEETRRKSNKEEVAIQRSLPATADSTTPSVSLPSGPA